MRVSSVNALEYFCFSSALGVLFLQGSVFKSERQFSAPLNDSFPLKSPNDIFINI